MVRPIASRLWLHDTPLLLASTSATRRMLLEGAGLPVETQAPGIDERAVEAAAGAIQPAGLAAGLAQAKAAAVATRMPGRIVIGADQVLELDGAVLHKPADEEDARAHLARLAGRTHALHTAVALAEGGAVVESIVDTARLTMRPLSPEAIATYVAMAGKAVVTASVGAYQLEAPGIHLFETVEGDHTTILGLPMIPLLALLRERGHLGF